MKTRIPRLARGSALVCLALAFLALAAFTLTARASARPFARSARLIDASARATKDGALRAKDPSRPLALREEGRTILAFPPRAPTTPRPLTVVYLHGLHGRAENGCPWLRRGASEVGWLVCPEANARLDNGTFSWSGPIAEERAVVARAERAAQRQGADPDTAGVLVGFSQGAFVALDLVGARLGRYRGLVLIGADVEPSRATLAAAGVERIVLVAGDLDAASSTMKRATARLRREGVDARFVSLGPVGHTYASPEPQALDDAIAWAGGGERG